MPRFADTSSIPIAEEPDALFKLAAASRARQQLFPTKKIAAKRFVQWTLSQT
jgi:hypothetical protein